VTYLLDVNVLVALIDPGHVGHDMAHGWFQTIGHRDWATCPLTENGVIRVVGHPRYPNTPGSPAAVAGIVSALRRHPGHNFWPDDFSLVASEHVDPACILVSTQVTDTYLLALAASKEGQLAALDRRLVTTAVKGGAAAIHQIAVD